MLNDSSSRFPRYIFKISDHTGGWRLRNTASLRAPNPKTDYAAVGYKYMMKILIYSFLDFYSTELGQEFVYELTVVSTNTKHKLIETQSLLKSQTPGA